MKKTGGNLHCIMAFTRSKFQGPKVKGITSRKSTTSKHEDVINKDVTRNMEAAGETTELADTFVMHSDEEEYDFNQVSFCAQQSW